MHQQDMPTASTYAGPQVRRCEPCFTYASTKLVRLIHLKNLGQAKVYAPEQKTMISSMAFFHYSPSKSALALIHVSFVLCS